jgi:hypothetical protein
MTKAKWQCQNCCTIVHTEYNAQHIKCCASPNYAPMHTGKRHTPAAEWNEFKNNGMPLGADLPKGYDDDL